MLSCNLLTLLVMELEKIAKGLWLNPVTKVRHLNLKPLFSLSKNKRVQNLAVSKEPWDLSEVIRDKHRINKNIPRLRPQKMYCSHVRSAAEMACLSRMTCSWCMRKWNTELTYLRNKCLWRAWYLGILVGAVWHLSQYVVSCVCFILFDLFDNGMKCPQSSKLLSREVVNTTKTSKWTSQSN